MARHAHSAGLTLSDLVLRSMAGSALTVARAEGEHGRTRELARLGNNLNQIARWAKSRKGAPQGRRRRGGRPPGRCRPGAQRSGPHP